MALKDKISSPLEAGTSILDAHHLPPHYIPAFEHASARLAKKSLHVTLVVVRRDYQSPSVTRPGVSPAAQAKPVEPRSPRLWLSSPPAAALRRLVHPKTMSNPPRIGTEIQGDGSTPLTPPLPSPATSSVGTPSSATRCSAHADLNPLGFRLVRPSGLPPWVDRALRHALSKAESKLNTGERIHAPMSPSASGLPDQLIHRSIAQNDVLFSSEGLTLLSLDRLYCLKAALSAYTKTKSPMRLEDAVDELHRYVLAANGRKVTKADLMRSYDWLSVSHWAMTDLDRMYKRAYGGPDRVGAISGLASRNAPKLPKPVAGRGKGWSGGDEAETSAAMSDGTEVAAPKAEPTTLSKVPVLKLQTNFDPPASDGGRATSNDAGATANNSGCIPLMVQPWTTSIDDILSADILSPVPGSTRLGPRTPNGQDDISPITRGEWGFLMVDGAFQSGKTAAVQQAFCSTDVGFQGIGR